MARKPPPDNAWELQADLQPLAATLRLGGWTVNLAVESGGDAESVTFSVSKPKRETYREPL